MTNKNFFVVQGWMINDLCLSGNELMLYAIIYGFSQDEDSEYYGSMRYIERSLKISLPTAHKLINKLLDKKLIERTSESHYRVLKKLKHGVKETLTLGVKETLTNKDNTNNKTKDTSFSLVAPPKDTYKSKHMIAKQKGIKLKKTPRTTKQEKTAEALKAITYYRERAMYLHRMNFLAVQDESRNKAVRKLAIRAMDYVNLKELIDWWLDGTGEFFGYEPEQCFSTKRIEKYLNNKNKKSKRKFA